MWAFRRSPWFDSLLGAFMRIAVISDIHGNLAALQAVLEDIQNTGVDAVYCLGDVVGYGAEPRACLDLVRAHCALCVRGNHEEALLQETWRLEMNSPAAQALTWTRAQLSEADFQEIAAWPLVRVGADARLVHASPDDPLRFRYLVSRLDCEIAFETFAEKLCFFGHTHIPLAIEEVVPGVVRTLSGPVIELDIQHRYLINVGSVGQPRDGNAQSRWVLVEDQPPRLVYKFVSYNIALTQTKIRQAGLPEILASRLILGK
jgi:predicted phosphodiesterase